MKILITVDDQIDIGGYRSEPPLHPHAGVAALVRQLHVVDRQLARVGLHADREATVANLCPVRFCPRDDGRLPTNKTQ